MIVLLPEWNFAYRPFRDAHASRHSVVPILDPSNPSVQYCYEFRRVSGALNWVPQWCRETQVSLY